MNGSPPHSPPPARLPRKQQSPATTAHPSLSPRALPSCPRWLLFLLLGCSLAQALPRTRAAADPATNAPAQAPAPRVIDIVRPAVSHPVDFPSEVLPFLQANCLPCHNKTTSKGELVLETPADMQKGGETGPAIVPGRAAESLLLQVATQAAKPRMPPRENKVNATHLTPQQLGLLALWIDQGADPGRAVDAPTQWRPVATNFHPAYAVAISPDGRLVAGSRANRVDLYRLAEPHAAQVLEDANLGPGVSQRDVVNSLAFSPDGTWLAAGGFREVRLWRRRPSQPSPFGAFTNVQSITLSPDASTLAVALPDGTVQLASATNGFLQRTLSKPIPNATHLRLNPNGQRLATASADGLVRVWDVTSGAVVATNTGGSPVSALSWCDDGRLLAVAREADRPIHLFQAPTETAGRLKLLADLPGHSNRIDALESAQAVGALLASGSRDGTVRLWPTSVTNAPRVFAVGAPVTALVVVGGGGSGNERRIAVATRTQGSQLWRVEDPAQPALRLAGDFRSTLSAGVADRQLAAARHEREFQDATLIRQEDELRKRTDDATKAAEKKQGIDKALAEKEQARKREEEALATATREQTDLSAQFAQATNRYAATRQAVERARTAAREATDRRAAAALAADQKAYLKSDLARILASLGPTNDAALLERTREAAAAADREANAAARNFDESKTAAERAVDELVALATADGEAKAAAELATRDLPPRIRQAADRSKSATQSLADLKSQLERARIQQDTAEADVQLAQRTLAAARRALDETRAALALAVSSVTEAEALARKAHAAQEAAVVRGHRWIRTSAHGHRLWTLDDEDRLMIWALPSGQPLLEATLPVALGDSLALLPDDTLVIPGPTGLVRCSPEESWELVRRIGDGDRTNAIVDRVNALAFSPDSRQLVTGGGEPSRSSELKIWSVADGSLVRDLGSLHSDCVLSVAYSPNGDLLATGGADRFLRVSDPGTGMLVKNFEGHTHHVIGVAWRADGRVLASAGGEGTVKLWNRLTGERLLNIEGFGKEVAAVQSLGLTGEFMAVAGSGQTRVFKEGNAQVRTLPSVPTFLHALAVTPDGRLAVTGGADGVVRVWDATEGKLRAEFPPFPSYANR